MRTPQLTLCILSFCWCISSFGLGIQQARGDQPHMVSRILFGSCIKQDQPMPIFRTMALQQAQLCLFLGDNIYADTHDMGVMKQKYQRLASDPDYQAFAEHCPILATWDDHDFGINDGGAMYTERDASQQEFLAFWKIPANDPRHQRPGIYFAERFGPPEKRVQIILLDTRYFRSELKSGEKRVGGPWVPDNDPQKTMLGTVQWKWLEAQLRIPAKVRFIASSIQFAATSDGQECWANFPQEQQRFVNLIRETQAQGVMFLSGDRHWAELSVVKDAPYPLYDLTSSSFNQIHPRGTPTINEHRASPATYHQANFGKLDIHWDAEDPLIELSVCDIDAKPRITHSLRLSQLRPH